ncbi:MAG: hypothetical protein LW595_00150 [Rickettsiales bacterium]|nr:hypothetical protein [Rickettsiales bacterium]
MSFSNKIIKTLLVPKNDNKISFKVPSEDFIPFVCHYDEETIVTKNGELMKTIRITGFSKDSTSNADSIREVIRKSIIDEIGNNINFSFWFHTIRRRKNIKAKGNFSDSFSQYIEDEWNEQNEWENQFINELYITIIIQASGTSLIDLKSLWKSLSAKSNRNLHLSKLNSSHKELTNLCNSILRNIADYGARILGIVEWKGILYSEQMRFFGKILNLNEERYPLSINDISADLATHKIAFGDREIQVENPERKSFGAILSLKEYREISIENLDNLLQMPIEFIISQSMIFDVNSQDFQSLQNQDNILKISEDKEFRNSLGIGNFFENINNLQTDYCKVQTNVMVIAENIDKLKNDVDEVTDKFNASGLSLVREELFLEHCFWAQIPANFNFLKRQKLFNSKTVAGFVALYSFPTGAIDGNHWGSAVSVIRTALNTPYFFNFHNKNIGHTIIVGGNDTDRSSLLNFFITQAMRFNPKLFYFDNNNAKILINGLNGDYHNIAEKISNKNNQTLNINPLENINRDNKEQKEFLINFFTSLVSFSKEPLSNSEIDIIPAIIENIIAKKIDNFNDAIELFNSGESREIYQRMQIWQNGKLSHIFNSKNNNQTEAIATDINWDNHIIGLNIIEAEKTLPIILPLFIYFLNKIEQKLDGIASIIVIDNILTLFENNILANKVDIILKRLTQKNCVVISTINSDKELDKSIAIKEIVKNSANQIYLPNKNPKKDYKTIFGLDDDEIEIIKNIQISYHHFLLKHNNQSIISSLYFLKTPEMFQLLRSDEQAVLVMEEVIEHIRVEKNQPLEKINSKEWLPQTIEILQDITEENRLAELDRIRQERIKEKQRIELLENS